MNAQAHLPILPKRLPDADDGWKPLPGSGLAELLRVTLWALLITLPFATIGGGAIYSEWSRKEGARLAAIEAALAHERLVAAPPQATLPVDLAAHGRDLFATACVACHGPSGTGVPGLGKNLTISDFVAALDDQGMHDFLVTGRLDAKPVPMPPRAGRPDLTDDDLRAIVTYVRGLQDPRRLPELPPMTLLTSAPTEDEKATALAAAGGDEELAEYIASGTKLYASTCIACHGPGGTGITGNGKALVNNQFIRSLDDDTLLAFVKKGRDPGNPANTTGIGMPSKGGNPALSDDDLLDIIAYLRTLQPQDARASLNGQ